MMTYAEKLRDPRWQRKRLEVLQRDEFSCLACGDSESTLHVHHRLYLKRLEPWDYPNHLLQTLCEECHKSIKSTPFHDQLAILDKSFWMKDAEIFNAIEGLTEELFGAFDLPHNYFPNCYSQKDLQIRIVKLATKKLIDLRRGSMVRGDGDGI